MLRCSLTLSRGPPNGPLDPLRLLVITVLRYKVEQAEAGHVHVQSSRDDNFPYRKFRNSMNLGGKIIHVLSYSPEIILSLSSLKVKSLSRVRLFATPWTNVAHQAPPSMGFSRQEYWSGLPFPSPLSSLIVHKSICFFLIIYHKSLPCY